MKREISKILKELGFKENEIKVYLALTNLGEAKASEIAKKAELPRTTTISILEKLADMQYLTTHQHKGLNYYWVESPHALVDIFGHKIEVAKSLSHLLADEYRQEAHFPFGKTIDTRQGISNYIEKLITGLPKNTTIRTIDNPGFGNYSKIFSGTKGFALNDMKKKKGIRTKSLLPFGTFSKEVEAKIVGQDIEIRTMPKEIRFEASFWLVEDKAFLFSGNPPFLNIVKHKLIVNSLESVYSFLWGISKDVSS